MSRTPSGLPPLSNTGRASNSGGLRTSAPPSGPGQSGCSGTLGSLLTTHLRNPFQQCGIIHIDLDPRSCKIVYESFLTHVAAEAMDGIDRVVDFVEQGVEQKRPARLMLV